jgi:hypothetical protein
MLPWLSYMLIDQEDPNVLPLCCEPLESLFDGCIVSLVIDNEKVLLRIWRWRNMLNFHQLPNSSSWRSYSYTNTCKQQSSYWVLLEISIDPPTLCTDNSHLIPNDCKELSVLVGRSWSCHYVVVSSDNVSTALFCSISFRRRELRLS